MSSNNQIFTTVKMSNPKRNVFDLGHSVTMSGKMGLLMPTLAMECVPGDKFKIGCNSLIRMAPMLAPIMHRVNVYMHYWFVPNRLVWENWPSFITGDEANPTVAPYIKIDPDNPPTADQLKMLDYFGIPPFPTGVGAVEEKVSAIPFAAFNKIYNDYYRDENLIPEVPYELADGDNSGIIADLLKLRKRAYEHDYFTSSLPFAQKGAAVDIPLGDVVLKDDWEVSNRPFFSDEFDDPAPVGQTLIGRAGPEIGFDNGVDGPYAYDPNGSLETSPTTINDLRRAIKLQEWLERNARGGTRYDEHIKAHFGVKPEDFRLQMAEYITGAKTPLVISEVLNTTGTNDAPQGDMSGHGVGVMENYNGNYFVKEYGYIIGIMSIIPRTAYQQGIPKHFLKTDYLDYYFPSFAHLGEQPVQNRELMAYTGEGDGTFGYVPRYTEYKYMPSRVAGDFRTTLNYWHLARILPFDPAFAPNLNQDFIECDPEDVKRIFAVQDSTDNIWIHINHLIKSVRPMPVFGTPML